MKSKDEQIEKFLAELKVKDSDKYEVLTNLRSVVFTSISNLSETFKYGGILFSINDSFGGLYVSKQHVSFEFTYGYKLDTELQFLFLYYKIFPFFRNLQFRNNCFGNQIYLIF